MGKRGGPPKIKSKSEKEERLALVWRMWNRGKPAWEIGKEIGISDRQVRYDLKTLESRWRQETSSGIEVHKQKVLAENHELLVTYWEAWARSLDEKTTSSTEQCDGSSGSKRRAAIKREQREGNSAFLDGVMKCLQERCKILGLNAPVTIDFSRLSVEDLIQLAKIVFGDANKADRVAVPDRAARA